MELARWLDHWSRHGFGYWTVCDLAGELMLGFGGLRRTDLDGEPVLNLHDAVRHDPGETGPSCRGVERRGLVSRRRRRWKRPLVRPSPGWPRCGARRRWLSAGG
ncbi:hypothetical protein [Micromonospora sp. ATA51]|uniref:hypothetical protein n=1 Tax=Micromonospora sp. ATA51 TaxID=2806098 RepID=UPI001A4EEE61|nr:hypothetical protein [Micromonospora sp. ATA51]MBM0225480.1 hypothetical protein [Micromonospora sp. ATA51]